MSGSRSVGPAVAGTWYPADANALARQVDGFLGDSPTPPWNPPRALIAPHAGFAYSGAVAGRVFRRLRGAACRRVLLLGPSHYEAFPGAAVPAAEFYRTPLGDVALDAEAIRSLHGATCIAVRNGPFAPEHSLEAEIPFLQRALDSGWRLIPLLIGAGNDRSSLGSIADAIAPLVDADTLIVVSSDFTHFGPRFGYEPFREDVPGNIERLDQQGIDRVLAGDTAGFEAYLDRTGATICGRDAIGVLLRLMPGLIGERVAYDTSGRITGDWSHSVSYAGLAFPARTRR